MQRKLSFTKFSFLLSLYFSAVINFPFFREFIKINQGFHLTHLAHYAVLFVFLTALFFLIIHTFLVKYITKFLSIFFILVSGFASYACLTYGTIFNSLIIKSIFTTTFAESYSFISWHFGLYFFFFILLPIVSISIIRIEYPPLFKFLSKKIITLGISCGCMAGLYFSNQLFFNNLFDKAQNRYLKRMIIPFNVVKGVRGYIHENDFFTPTHTMRVSSEGAPRKLSKSLPYILNTTGRKKLVVFILGESARASSFSLNGYKKKTNPQLEKWSHLYSFTNFYSCGTATAISVPCIFSSIHRKNFAYNQLSKYENLLDVIRSAGTGVTWVDNGMGSQHVVHEGIKNIKIGTYYEADLDSALLNYIPTKKDLAKNNHDRFLVLHQRGSHGPDYWQRYDRSARIFRPDCSDAALASSCTHQEIINAYDNTIVFTDKNISDTIQKLQSLSDIYDTAMIYVSDHGESTGEYGLYMHGIPYAIAPDDQKHVPFIAWFSQPFLKHTGLKTSCLDALKNQHFSQDHIFSTVLSLLNVKSYSHQYEQKWDMFENCFAK